MTAREDQPQKLPIDRPCSACSAGDYEMEYHDHHPPFSKREDQPRPTPDEWNAEFPRDNRLHDPFEKSAGEAQGEAPQQDVEVYRKLLMERFADRCSMEQIASAAYILAGVETGAHPSQDARESYVECSCDPMYAHHCMICGGTGRKKIRVAGARSTPSLPSELERELQVAHNILRQFGRYCKLPDQKCDTCLKVEAAEARVGGGVHPDAWDKLCRAEWDEGIYQRVPETWRGIGEGSVPDGGTPESASELSSPSAGVDLPRQRPDPSGSTPTQASISIEIYQHDWVPGFAGFRDDGAIEEGAAAHVILNLGSLLCCVETGELSAKDLPYMVAESLMHEAIHALEAWAKVEFSEDRVEELLEKYRAKYRPDDEAHWQRDPEAKRDNSNQFASGSTPSPDPPPCSNCANLETALAEARADKNRWEDHFDEACRLGGIVKTGKEDAEKTCERLREALRLVLDELHEINLANSHGNKPRNPEMTVFAEVQGLAALAPSLPTKGEK